MTPTEPIPAEPTAAEPTPADAVVELRQVTKSYPGPPAVVALDRVDLVVRTGEMVAITGPSGSGKSTLLNLLGTLDRPTEGTVVISGVDASDMSDRARARLRAERIGFVFQQFHLLEAQSALDNVAAGLLYRGTSRRERRARAAEALARVGLGDRAGARPGTLSGGQRQRVAIARALAGEPALLLADEPTGNLDSATSAEILGLLHELHRDGSTIAVVTHDREVAGQIPRRVELLDGRVALDRVGGAGGAGGAGGT
jgi:putative ABC transport system ATP-binding protein